MKHTVFVAGKSGGHIIPAVTLAEQYHSAGHVSSIITHDLPLDRSLCSDARVMQYVLLLSLRSMSSRKVWMYPWYVYDVVRAIWLSYRFLRDCGATELVSMGGAISLPAVIAARLCGLPVVLYELNAVPGRAVQFLVPYVHEVRYCFAAAQKYFATVGYAHQAPYPLRHTHHDIQPLQTARMQLGIELDTYVMLVIGGSQGSKFINQAVCVWIASLTDEQRKRLFMVHQAGSADAVAQVQEWYASYGVRSCVQIFFTDLSVYYCAANSVVTRAGAGALHETLFFRRPAIIIPLEIAETSHQVDNAQAFALEHPEICVLISQRNQALLMSSLTDMLARV